MQLVFVDGLRKTTYAQNNKHTKYVTTNYRAHYTFSFPFPYDSKETYVAQFACHLQLILLLWSRSDVPYTQHRLQQNSQLHSYTSCLYVYIYIYIYIKYLPVIKLLIHSNVDNYIKSTIKSKVKINMLRKLTIITCSCSSNRMQDSSTP